MPRQARLDAPGTLHHVIARGIERQKIFRGEADYADFLVRVERAVTSGGARVFAWALIPNHFHLVLRTGETHLSATLRRALTGYSVAFNLRHRRHGHLFQNRYKSIVCEEETYLLELVRSVHLNPLRAKVVADEEELARYPYCGHAAILGFAERPWQAVDDVVGRFGSEVAHARRVYREFVSAGVTQGNRPDRMGGGLRRSCGGAGGIEPSQEREGPPAYDARVRGSPEFVAHLWREADSERRMTRRRRRPPLEALGARVPVGTAGYSGTAVPRYLGVAASTVNRQASRTDLMPLADALRATL